MSSDGRTSSSPLASTGAHWILSAVCDSRKSRPPLDEALLLGDDPKIQRCDAERWAEHPAAGWAWGGVTWGTCYPRPRASLRGAVTIGGATQAIVAGSCSPVQRRVRCPPRDVAVFFCMASRSQSEVCVRGTLPSGCRRFRVPPAAPLTGCVCCLGTIPQCVFAPPVRWRCTRCSRTLEKRRENENAHESHAAKSIRREASESSLVQRCGPLPCPASLRTWGLRTRVARLCVPRPQAKAPGKRLLQPLQAALC